MPLVTRFFGGLRSTLDQRGRDKTRVTRALRRFNSVRLEIVMPLADSARGAASCSSFAVGHAGNDPERNSSRQKRNET
ncbi:hypothetical protein EVAR_98839_1 [Eumeta japonica]|uniref:Uncharacterized protein n=1 Tax=Eumeta variegata TaxID=151549 RepID=A0A4C1YIE1_EUMVA|nr:hypothetical protein EVAR_98839_1 [Eumeta japonica]